MMNRFFGQFTASVAGLAHNASEHAKALIEHAPLAVAGLAHNANEHAKTFIEHAPLAAAGLAHNANEHAKALTRYVSETPWFFRAVYITKNLPYSQLTKQLVRWIKLHPYKTAFMLTCVTTLMVPSLVTYPLLSILGFGAEGIVAGSIAASLHSFLGPIVSGSLFAALQSAGAGGLGLALVNMLAQASAAVLMGSIAASEVIGFLRSRGLVTFLERIYGRRGGMIARQMAENASSRNGDARRSGYPLALT